MTLKTKKGYSLVEVMVVVMIATVVFAAIHATYLVGNKTWKYYHEEIGIKKEVRRAMMGLIRDLREGEKVRINQNRDGTAIHFYRPAFGDISYVWKKKGEQAYHIIKHDLRGTRIYARNISSMTFRKSRKAIFVNLAGSMDPLNPAKMQVALREQVALRPKATLYTN